MYHWLHVGDALMVTDLDITDREITDHSTTLPLRQGQVIQWNTNTWTECTALLLDPSWVSEGPFATATVTDGICPAATDDTPLEQVTAQQAETFCDGHRSLWFESRGEDLSDG